VNASTRTEQFVALAEQQFGISHEAAVARIAEMQRADEAADAAYRSAHPDGIQGGPDLSTFEASMKSAAGIASPAEIAEYKRLCDMLDAGTLPSTEFKHLCHLQDLVLLPPARAREQERLQADVDARSAAMTEQVLAHMRQNPELRAQLDREAGLTAGLGPLPKSSSAKTDGIGGGILEAMYICTCIGIAAFVGWWCGRFAYRSECSWNLGSSPLPATDTRGVETLPEGVHSERIEGVVSRNSTLRATWFAALLGVSVGLALIFILLMIPFEIAWAGAARF
jgi:hypothetical protein